MLKVLLPVDGSENSNRAVKHLIHLVKSLGAMEIHVVNVQPALLYVEVLLKPRQDMVAEGGERGVPPRLRLAGPSRRSLRGGDRLRRGGGGDYSVRAAAPM